MYMPLRPDSLYMEIPIEALDAVLFRISHLQEGRDGITGWQASVVETGGETARLALSPTRKAIVGDMEIVGHGERATEGELQLHPLPGQDPGLVDSFNNDKCDVCGTRRARRHLLIKHDDQLLTVGVPCLVRAHVIDDTVNPEEFFQSAVFDPRKVLQLTVSRFMSQPPRDTLEVLAAAIWCVRNHGYVSKSRGSYLGKVPTASLIATLLANRDAGGVPHEVSDNLLAAAVLRNEILALPQREDDDFLARGVRLLQKMGLREGEFGVIAAMPRVYSRLNEPPRPAWAEGWEGTVGERVTLHATLESINDIRHADGMTSKKFVFRTPENKCLSWITQADVTASVGTHLQVTGTVKRHGVFRDVCETILSRCRLHAAA